MWEYVYVCAMWIVMAMLHLSWKMQNKYFLFEVSACVHTLKQCIHAHYNNGRKNMQELKYIYNTDTQESHYKCSIKY